MEVIFENHQEAVEIPLCWLTAMEAVGREAVDLAIQAARMSGCPLADLEVIEIALVDDGANARVHEDFLGIAGATDVITFHHGEIVIGAEVAREQALEYGEPLGRELLRYFIHGLLHLAGHDDVEAEDAERMESEQEKIVEALWIGGLAGKLV